MKVDVLGTTYTIEVRKISEDEIMKKNEYCGYCCDYPKKIVIADMTEKEYFDFENEEERKVTENDTLRHEIIHAFLNESGLGASANQSPHSWAKNEEMVDWIAIQFPKILKAFQEVGAI